MTRSQETRLKKLEQVRSARRRRYCFHFDEVAEAEAQGLPYVLVPRVLSPEEWEKKYCTAGGASVKRNSLPSAVPWGGAVRHDRVVAPDGFCADISFVFSKIFRMLDNLNAMVMSRHLIDRKHMLLFASCRKRRVGR
jgi:hypothetical protein